MVAIIHKNDHKFKVYGDDASALAALAVAISADMVTVFLKERDVNEEKEDE